MSEPTIQSEADRIIASVGGLHDVQDMMLMSADRNIYGAKNDILDAINRAESLEQIKRIHRACEEYMKAFDFIGHRAMKKWDELLSHESR